MKANRLILTVLLLLCMVLGSLTALTCFSSDDSGVQTYEGQTGPFRVISFDTRTYRFSVKLDYDWFVYGDNTMYYSDLAQLAVTASNAVYASSGSTATGDIPGYSTAFFEAIGLDDVESVSVSSQTGKDKKDVTNFIAGHKKVRRDGQDYEIIFVTVRGSLLDEDWESNFDLGADTEAYYNLTGEHPEWTKKYLHKGFAVASDRAKSEIDAYVSANVDADAEKIIMITGHSRGGSIANILGTFYEDDKENYAKSFTYTFAAANTTTVSLEEASGYQTIFNIVNEDDLVPAVPLAVWNDFKRYGTDLSASASSYSEMYRTITGQTYASANGASMASEWADITTSREAMYEFDYSNKSLVDYGTHLSLVANTVSSLLSATLSANGATNYVDLRKEKSGFATHIYFYYRPAYLLLMLSDMMTGDNILSAGVNLIKYPLSDQYYSTLSNIVSAVTDESIINSHLPNAYYCIASSDFGYDQSQFMPDEPETPESTESEESSTEESSTEESSTEESSTEESSTEESSTEESSTEESSTEESSSEPADDGPRYNVVIHSRRTGGDSSVAHITGGGEYTTATGGVIEAPAETDGLVFAGWYVGLTSSTKGTLFSKDPSIRVYPAEDMVLTALYKAKDQITFDLTIDAENYRITTKYFSADYSKKQTISFSPGTEVTITLIDREGSDLCWRDGNGVRLGLIDPITITLTRDLVMTAGKLSEGENPE